MKIYIVVVYEQVAYAISAEESDSIETIKKNRLYPNCLFVTPHVSELLSCLDDGCMAKILDFECLDKEIRQSLNYVDIHKWEWNEAETSHTQYTAYQKHPCHRCGAPINPPPRFRILLC